MRLLKTNAQEQKDGWFLLEVAADGKVSDHLLSACKPYWENRNYEQRVEEGSALWKATFDSSLSKMFYNLLREVKSRGISFKLALEIKAAGLRNLDWESLYDPEKRRFLLEDTAIQIYRSSAQLKQPSISKISIPAQTAFIRVRNQSSATDEIETWLENSLSALVDTGCLQYEILEAASLKKPLGPSTQLFHLFVEMSEALLEQACESRAWGSAPAFNGNIWDNIRSSVPPTAIGIISCASSQNPLWNLNLVEKLQEKGWPFFCRLDLFYYDIQEELAITDLYSLVASESCDDTRLGMVQHHQLDLDSRTARRHRTIQFFSTNQQPIYQISEIERTENDLQSFLRSTITAVEEFYQWERMYAELIFSTRLRLQKVDLSNVEDIRQMEEKIFHLSDALVEFNKLVMIGEPGTGKTTACKRAAWELARRAYKELSQPTRPGRPRIPLYLALKTLSGSQEEATDLILNHISKQLFSGSPPADSLPKEMDKFLSKYQLVLLLDGLNEVSPPVRRRKVIEEIFQLQSQYSKSINIVVTSRKHDFDVVKFRRQGGFEVLEIIELSPNDIKKFAKCYLFDAESVERFASSLNRQIQAAARNPLMLRLLLDDFKQGERLIGSRAQLLDRFCRRCLEKPCETLDEPISHQVMKKEKLLTSLAFETWRAGFSLSAPLEDCVRFAEQTVGSRDKAHAIIHEIAENGILSISMNDEGEYSVEFQYQSYHEYFSAKRVANLWTEKQTRLFQRLLKQDGWHEIIALAAGIIELERKKSGLDKDKRYDRDLIVYLQSRRKIILAGMCVWNMEGRDEELFFFEKWLVDRAHAACNVLTNVSTYFLFFIIIPIWLLSVFLAIVWASEYEYYLIDFKFFRLGSGLLIYLLPYLLIPPALFYLYRRFSTWIATKQEDLVLRPSLAALYFIGSEFTRASIVDLFNKRDIASTLDTEDDNVITINDPTVKTQRRALKGIKDFSPNRRYSPEDLFLLLESDARTDDIFILARIVAKDFSSHLLRRLAELANSSDSSRADKAYQAGALLVTANMELRDEWNAWVKGLRQLPVVEIGRRGFLYGLWEQFISSPIKQKIFILAFVVFAGAVIGGVIMKDMNVVLGALVGLATNLIAPSFMKKDQSD